ncbi:MFS transporter [Amycolatopsis albispora]|uniref:Transporter n=1 Tax=Amycolatopsis albispora TaxID=1804986 RepID=A0A344L5C6_9PSEU|nr:MFS transporter [Amycolatopsis albispora]AXB43250.1 transporter [Amycolatopsis albispora]
MVETRAVVTGRSGPDAGRQRWGAAWAAMFGVFVLVVAEQLPIGLLTQISPALAVTEGLAGLSVTVPSIIAGVAAPLVPLVAGRLDRRILLVALMVLMSVANVASWLAPTFEVLLVSRVFVGIAIGGFWAIGGGLAVRLVSAENVPKATSIIFAGVAAANVLGVPLGTILGTGLGWRFAFAALGVAALVALVGLILLLPPLSAQTSIGPRLLFGQLGNRAVAVGLLATLFCVAGHFAAFTFVGPILRDIAGLPAAAVGPVLLVYGLLGLGGNFAAGSQLGRSVTGVVISILAVIGIVLGLVPVLGGQPVSGVVLLLVWGLFFGGLSVSMQTWMIKAAPAAVEAATSLWVGVWNLSIGLGALVGGVAIDRLSLAATIWIAAVLTLIAFLLVVFTRPARAAVEARAARG